MYVARGEHIRQGQPKGFPSYGLKDSEKGAIPALQYTQAKGDGGGCVDLGCAKMPSSGLKGRAQVRSTALYTIKEGWQVWAPAA